MDILFKWLETQVAKISGGYKIYPINYMNLSLYNEVYSSQKFQTFCNKISIVNEVIKCLHEEGSIPPIRRNIV